jgi:hypothetical protein
LLVAFAENIMSELAALVDTDGRLQAPSTTGLVKRIDDLHRGR